MKKVHSTTNLDKLSSRIAAVSQDEIRIAVLKDEIETHKSRLEPHDTGHLHTAISVIQHRITELTCQMFDNPVCYLSWNFY